MFHMLMRLPGPWRHGVASTRRRCPNHQKNSADASFDRCRALPSLPFASFSLFYFHLLSLILSLRHSRLLEVDGGLSSFLRLSLSPSSLPSLSPFFTLCDADHLHASLFPRVPYQFLQTFFCIAPSAALLLSLVPCSSNSFAHCSFSLSIGILLLSSSSSFRGEILFF